MRGERTKPAAAFFWRRLDEPGHDSCRLFKLPNGWCLAGAAVFREQGRPCHFKYEVLTDAAWRTRRASVAGYFGNKAIELRISAAGKERWKLDGVAQDKVTGCIDVDLAFTPATNLIAIRRLALKIGQRAEAPAAYLDFPKSHLVKLPQTYHRIGRAEYEYESPTAGYAATLKVAPSGAVIDYPGVFEQVLSS